AGEPGAPPGAGGGGMSLPEILIVVVWAGLTLYAILGGADFGAGVLHLLAPADRRGRVPPLSRPGGPPRAAPPAGDHRRDGPRVGGQSRLARVLHHRPADPVPGRVLGARGGGCRGWHASRAPAWCG